MPLLEAPSLSDDEIDDLLYCTRVNEADELSRMITEFAQKYNCSNGAILSAGVDLESGNTLLHYCSANGFTDLLKSLLEQLGIKREANGAADSKKPEVIMINRTNNQGNTPLHWAAYNGHLEVVKMLVAAGSDIWLKNAAGHLAMFEAERAEKSEVVQYLLEAGGEKVERAGVETEPTAEDVEDVPNGEPGPASGSSTGATQEFGTSG